VHDGKPNSLRASGDQGDTAGKSEIHENLLRSRVEVVLSTVETMRLRLL
jgi:hypothetical protein